MATHKCKTANRHCSSKLIIESGKYEVEILEECEEDMRLEREQYWMDKINCVNKNNTYNSRKWDKNEENKLKMKQWRIKHKQYKDSWGGDKRSHNNLLCIDLNVFR
jgi:hypothetical protein